MTEYIIKFVRVQFSKPISAVMFAISMLSVIVSSIQIVGFTAGLILGVLQVILLELCAALIAYYIEKK